MKSIDVEKYVEESVVQRFSLRHVAMHELTLELLITALTHVGLSGGLDMLEGLVKDVTEVCTCQACDWCAKQDDLSFIQELIRLSEQ